MGKNTSYVSMEQPIKNNLIPQSNDIQTPFFSIFFFYNDDDMTCVCLDLYLTSIVFASK